MIKSFIVLSFLFVTVFSFAQENEEVVFSRNGMNTVDTTTDVRSHLNFNGKQSGNVQIVKDARIDGLIEFMGTPIPPDPVQINGYRVQVYFDKDIAKARDIKASFMTTYPKMKVYLEWDAPNHYVRVGNFRTELQALKFQEHIKDHYPETTVVKSKVDLPDVDEEQRGYDKKKK
jgi:hypothetical protein